MIQIVSLLSTSWDIIRVDVPALEGSKEELDR
jgi:hypothetical protein